MNAYLRSETRLNRLLALAAQPVKVSNIQVNGIKRRHAGRTGADQDLAAGMGSDGAVSGTAPRVKKVQTSGTTRGRIAVGPAAVRVFALTAVAWNL
jgi:hypothetical protein